MDLLSTGFRAQYLRLCSRAWDAGFGLLKRTAYIRFSRLKACGLGLSEMLASCVLPCGVRALGLSGFRRRGLGV